MRSLSKQVELTQLGLDSLNLDQNVGLSLACLVGHNNGPSMNGVRHDGDRRVRRRNPVLRSELLEDQKDELVCGHAFSSHSGSIAEEGAVANRGGVL